MGADARHTLVVDGTCALCRRSVAWVRARDTAGAIDCVAFQDSAVLARFPALDREACERAVQLVAPDGRVWSGAAAIERVILLLPHGRAVAWLFRLPLAGRLAERVYDTVARNRHRLDCGAHCGRGG